ncbi:MAG: ABC transporter permease [Chloroflexota bacterium]
MSWVESFLHRLHHGIRRYLPSISLLLAALVAWQVFTAVRQVPDYLLPGPLSIWHTAMREHDLLLQNSLPTLKIALLGYLLALVLGLALAVSIRYSRWIELAVYPIVIGTQTVPLIALAPILVVALGFSILPKLIIVCLVCFFPITVNAVDGFKGVDPDLINLMRSLGARRWMLFRNVEWPAALPAIFTGAKVAVTFAVIGAIWGEWVGSSEGLGWVMIQKEGQLDTGALFAAMAILTIMGIALFASVSIAERLLLPWYHADRALRTSERK